MPGKDAAVEGYAVGGVKEPRWEINRPSYAGLLFMRSRPSPLQTGTTDATRGVIQYDGCSADLLPLQTLRYAQARTLVSHRLTL